MANDKRKLGPNAKRLLSRFIARVAVPPGGGMESSLRFFADTVTESLRRRPDLFESDGRNYNRTWWVKERE